MATLGPAAECECGAGQDGAVPSALGDRRVFAHLVGLASAQQRMEAALGEIQSAVQEIAAQMRHQQPVRRAREDSAGSVLSPEVASPSSAGRPSSGSNSCSRGVKVEVHRRSARNPAWPQSVQCRYSQSHGLLDGRRQPRQFEPMVTDTTDATHGSGRSNEEGPNASRLMLNPNSMFHTVYSQLLLIVLCHDLTAVPVILAWDMEPRGWLLWTSWSACLVWTIDIVLNFVTGVYVEGQLVMARVPVARHYLRRCFMLDLLLILCEWLSLILFGLAMEAPSSEVMLHMAKHAKLLKTAGLLRLLKFPTILSKLADKSLSERVCWSLRCAGSLAAILFLNHMIACAWFAIGRLAHADTGMRWVDHSRSMDGASLEFLSSDGIYQWVTAMHWSMATLTLGSTDIACYNSAERFFTIVCMAIGLLFGSTLVSLFSASMIEHQMRMKGPKDKIRTLRRFLHANRITQKTSCLVMQQASERLTAQETLMEEDVRALPELSRNLQVEVHFELFHEHIKRFPLLNLWTCMDLPAMKRICMEALKVVHLRQQDDLFSEGTTTDRAYYLSKGRMIYFQPLSFVCEPDSAEQVVEAARWMSEASLWSHWAHVGTAKAVMNCEVSSISAERLKQVLWRSCRFSEMAAMYSQAYNQCIANAKPPTCMWPNDLEVPGTDFKDLMAEMGSKTKAEISLAVIEHLRLTQWTLPSLSAGGSKGFHNEIDEGKCCIILNSNHAERLVHLVQLHLADQQGQILVEFHWGKPNYRIPTFRLPSVMPMPGELLNRSAARLLEHFCIPESEVEYVRFERVEELDYSPSNPMHTRFVKHIHYMNLTADLTLPFPIGSFPGRMSDATSNGPQSSQVRKPTPARRSTMASFATFRGFGISHGSSEASDQGPHNSYLGSFIYVGKQEENCFYAWLSPGTWRLLSSPAGHRARADCAKQLKHLNKSDTHLHLAQPAHP